MKRKYMAAVIVLVLAAGIGVTGCSSGVGGDKTSQTKASLGEDFAQEYYMLSVTDYQLNQEEILSVLIEDYESYKDQVQVGLFDSDLGGYENQLLTDGPAYSWYSFEDEPNKLLWWKFADGVIGEVKVPMQKSVEDQNKTKEQALEVAELFDAALVCTSEEKYSGEGNIEFMVYDFQQQYEGTCVAEHVWVEVGNERLSCPSFYVDVDGNGVCLLSVSGLLDIGEPIKTYQSSEFISLAEAEKKIENYCASISLNIGAEEESVDVTIQEANIVYIPYMEQNQKVLIPAYELYGTEQGGSTDESLQGTTYRYVVDVFTGYVYDYGTVN